MDSKQHFRFWYFVGAMLVLGAVQTFLGNSHVQVFAYSDFRALLQRGRIKEVSIAEDQLTGIGETSGITAGQ
jgi:cell division protease FtsH